MPAFKKPEVIHAKIEGFLQKLKSPPMDRLRETATANITSSSSDIRPASMMTGIDEKMLRDVFYYLQEKQRKAEEDVFTQPL